MVRSEGDLIQGEMGRASQLCVQVGKGRDPLLAFKARREKSAGEVHLWCQQQGQGELEEGGLWLGRWGRWSVVFPTEQEMGKEGQSERC